MMVRMKAAHLQPGLRACAHVILCAILQVSWAMSTINCQLCMNGAMVLYKIVLDCAVSIIAVPEALMTSEREITMF